jgi:hypothetical protein
LNDENDGIGLVTVAVIVPPSVSTHKGIQYVIFSPAFMVLLAGIAT